MQLFRSPVLLAWLAAAFTGLIFFRFKAEESRLSAARRVLGPAFESLSSGPGAARRRLRGLLYFAALGLLVLAAAGPQWGVELAPVTDLKGNVVVAVDASLSMAARDLKPDRMGNARLLLDAIAQKFSDYRVGIVAFAGTAFVQCPLTTDEDAISDFADTLRPGMMPVQGTDFSEAIETTLRMLSRYGGQKVMVLITDGEDHSTGLDEALADAQKQGLKIFTVGIGTADGDLIPVTDASGNTVTYKKDKSGKTVVSRLGETTLMKIASSTGAAYLRYTDPGAAADSVYSAVSALDLQKSKGRGRAGHKNRFQWPLSLALALLLIEFMVMEKGFRLNLRLPRLPGRFGKGALVLPLLLLPLAGARAAGQGAEARKGNSSYAAKDWQEAVEHYNRALLKAPADKRLNFNIGDAYYRMNDYDKAADSFGEATTSRKINDRAYYNLGNALFRKKDLQGAIAAYRDAINADPKDQNAKFNLQVALEQQQKSSSNDKKKKNGAQNKQNQKQGSGKDKQKQQSEQQKRQAQAREQSKQILEMMKEKERSEQQDRQNMMQAAMRQGKQQQPDRLEDW